MIVKQGFMLRVIAGNYVVVPVGKAAVDFNGIITLNATGAFLWEQLTSDTTLEALLSKMIATYDVSMEQATSDLKEFINTLKQANLLD